MTYSKAKLNSNGDKLLQGHTFICKNWISRFCVINKSFNIFLYTTNKKLTVFFRLWKIFCCTPQSITVCNSPAALPSINWSHQTKKSGGYVPHEYCKRGQSEDGNPVDVTWILSPCWWSRLPFTVDANNPHTLYSTSCLGFNSPTQRHRPKVEATNWGFSIIIVIRRQVSAAVNFNSYNENTS
jgi:hypothetical protein